MRTRIMLRKHDVFPSHYGRLVDFATPLGLSAVLEPSSQTYRYVGGAEISASDKRGIIEKPVLDGYGRYEKTSISSTKFKFVVDGLDKSEKHIEQVFKMEDLRKDMIDMGIIELVTDHVEFVRPAPNDCPICDVHGFQNIILSEHKQDPGYSFIGENKESHSSRVIRILSENNLLHLYPEPFIKRYVRALLAVDTVRGDSGSELVPASKFIPKNYGQKYVERLELPLVKERSWTDFYQGEINCIGTWQSPLSGSMFRTIKEAV